MKTQTQEALKMAIEALDRVAEYLAGDEQFNFDIYKLDKAFFACKEALAQPAQNKNFCSRCGKRLSKDPDHIHTCTPPKD